MPLKTPSETDFISVAWGADKVGDPIVYAVCKISKTRPRTIAEERVPTICITCCFHGVAPTIWPALRSCRLSPPIAAAQHTTAPTIIALAAPTPDPVPKRARSKIDVKRMVAIVTPDADIVDNAKINEPAYLVFKNYELILKWNRSLRFGLAVCTLKNKLKNEL